MAKKKRKVRVEFRKNREKRTRHNNFTNRTREENLDDNDLIARERITGKGDLTRYRTVMGVESEDAGHGTEIMLDVDESKCLAGRVVSATGLNCMVESEDGRRFECTVRRVVRTMARDGRNAVVAGDKVLFQTNGEEQGVIERVNPRRGTLSRGSQRREHMIVSNVDQVLIVVSAADPQLKPHLIDRFLVSAEKGDVRAIVCINKADLVDAAALQPIAGLYAGLGYEVVLASAVAQTGIARLRTLLRNRETVFAGQSGVGKSSLLNAIEPGLDLRTAEVSDWTRKGKHTTRRAVLLKLGFGGWVVDTPGIRQMELWDVIPAEVEVFFVEFRPFVAHCKFPDCSHTHEDGCGVKRAVAYGLISETRYESYVRIVLND